MKVLKQKKSVAALLAVLVVAIAAIGAYAYWTTSGTGAGGATVGTDNGVSITNVLIPDNLYPGDSVTVTFDIENDSADAPVQIDKVVADLSEGTNGISAMSDAGCLAADFTFDDVTVDDEIAAGGSLTGVTGTLNMADTGLNQDACKNATFTLNLKVDDSAI